MALPTLEVASFATLQEGRLQAVAVRMVNLLGGNANFILLGGAVELSDTDDQHLYVTHAKFGAQDAQRAQDDFIAYNAACQYLSSSQADVRALLNGGKTSRKMPIPPPRIMPRD